MASILLGLVMSFFIAGLGIAYAGDMTQGIGIILLWMILCLISVYSTGMISAVVGILAFVVWMYSFIATFIFTAKSGL